MRVLYVGIWKAATMMQLGAKKEGEGEEGGKVLDGRRMDSRQTAGSEHKSQSNNLQRVRRHGPKGTGKTSCLRRDDAPSNLGPIARAGASTLVARRGRQRCRKEGAEPGGQAASPAKIKGQETDR